MATEDGAELKKNKKTLLVALLTLVIIIVAAIIIIALLLNNSVNNNETDSGYILPEELMGDDLSPVDQVIKETSLMQGDPNVSADEIKSYYDEVINNALKDGDSSFAAKIIIQKMNYISVIENDCEGASRYVDGIDLTPYSDKEKNYLASYVISMAIECNNQELRDEWSSILVGGQLNDE